MGLLYIAHKKTLFDTTIAGAGHYFRSRATSHPYLCLSGRIPVKMSNIKLKIRSTRAGCGPRVVCCPLLFYFQLSRFGFSCHRLTPPPLPPFSKIPLLSNQILWQTDSNIYCSSREKARQIDINAIRSKISNRLSSSYDVTRNECSIVEC